MDYMSFKLKNIIMYDVPIDNIFSIILYLHIVHQHITITNGNNIILELAYYVNRY